MLPDIAHLHIKCVCYRYCTLAYIIYMPYNMCMFQLLPGCNVACMQRYTVDIHRQGNTAMRCLRSFHAMLVVTAEDRKAKVELLLNIQLE